MPFRLQTVLPALAISVCIKINACRLARLTLRYLFLIYALPALIPAQPVLILQTYAFPVNQTHPSSMIALLINALTLLAVLMAPTLAVFLTSVLPVMALAYFAKILQLTVASAALAIILFNLPTHARTAALLDQ